MVKSRLIALIILWRSDFLVSEVGMVKATKKIFEYVDFIRRIVGKKYSLANVTNVTSLVAVAKWAQVIYPRNTKCLVRSIAMAALFRFNVIDARIMVGITKEPPIYMHAWVEVNGVPINDESGVVSRFKVLTVLG